MWRFAFTFNGIGIPLAAAGVVPPMWAMAALAASVISLFNWRLAGLPVTAEPASR